MIVNGEAAMAPELKGLWLRCFADSEEDVDYFLERRFPGCGSMVAVEDGEIAAMVFLLPARLVVNRKAGSPAGGREASYVYAFATHPDFRGRGIATLLLGEVQRRNREKGILTFLCPAEEALVSFYEKRGFYQSFFASIREAPLDVGGGLDGVAGTCAGQFFLESCSPLEYAAIRAEYLRDGDIAWDESAVRYAVEENSHSGGECRKVLLPDGQEGAVLIGIQGNCLRLREVLLPEQYLLAGKGYLQGLAAQIAKELDSERGIALERWQAVMPVIPGDAEKKWIGMSDEPGIRGYLNLVLD